MIFDREACLSVDATTDPLKPTHVCPFDVVPEPLELGPMDDPYGPGEPILVFVKVSGLIAGANSRINILGADTVAGPFLDQDMSVSVGPKALAKGSITFGLPTSIANAIQIELTGFTAGTFESFVVVRTM